MRKREHTAKYESEEYCEKWANYVSKMLRWRSYSWGNDGCITQEPRRDNFGVFTIAGFSPQTIMSHLISDLECKAKVKRP